jgi:hypothetical protein
MALRIIKNTLNEVETYNGPHKQLDFQSCWSLQLQNPFLNKMYKESVPYTERWFLESRRLINEEMWSHPLLVSIVLDQNLRFNLVKSTLVDGAIMRDILNNESMPEYHTSASVNLKKLIRWCAFFVSLPDSQETLVALNGQSRD